MTKGASLLIILAALCLPAPSLHAQTKSDKSAKVDSLARRTYITQRTARAPVIDGILEPEVYNGVPVTGEFTNLEPTYGPVERWPTRVRILYDDRSLYIAAELYAPGPDSISREVRPRDQIGNADWFGIAIDPYRSGVNGFEFISVVTGGQFDAILSDNGEDENWDAVWRNAVVRTDSGWTIEMEIPYSAIRFPDAPMQTWGINLFRRNAAAQQKSFWNPVDPNKPGFLTQTGTLMGIRDISPPVRLQLLPFVVASGADYVDNTGASAKTHTFSRSFSAGADLKVGLSDAFTLDATLIPDFSEARQDNQVLNLSPFEVRFDEARPFFTEGVELFNKGGYFYSRRVGGVPIGFGEAYAEAERIDGEVISNPQTARLLNATKVSGRTTKGTGIGVFNAISGEARAVIRTAEGEEREFVTQPITNYSVVVVDQLLPNNGYASLVNTNVMRSGTAYDANLTAAVFDVRNKGNTYGLTGNLGLSQRYLPEKTELGRNIELGFGDIDGKVTWGVNYQEIGPRYNPSDLGFFRRRNVRQLSGSLGFFQAEELGPFNRIGAWLNAGYERYVDPDDYSEFSFTADAFGRSKGNWTFNPFVYFEPAGTRDRFEPRVDGRVFVRPPSGQMSMYVGSDRRKKFYAEGNVGASVFWAEELGRRGYRVYLQPSYRLSPNFTVSMSTYVERNRNQGGFATFVDSEPVFGRRDREEITNDLRLIYTITPQVSFDVRTRHYWSRVSYREYFDLTPEGGLRQNPSYAERVDRDETYNALTTDLVFRWRFAPGSDLLFIWKDALFAGVPNAEFGYGGTWREGLMQEPRTETLTLKVNYFLDWDRVRRG